MPKANRMTHAAADMGAPVPGSRMAKQVPVAASISHRADLNAAGVTDPEQHTEEENHTGRHLNDQIPRADFGCGQIGIDQENRRNRCEPNRQTA